MSGPGPSRGDGRGEGREGLARSDPAAGGGRPSATSRPDPDETVIDLQLQAMAFESAIRYAERVVPRSLLEFLA